MYRFMPSAQPVANPLQGLIGLGAVSSYYRTPVYSCSQSADVVEYATSRCASRSPDKEVNYKKGYSTILKGTIDNPYQITIKDLYQNLFDSCQVKLKKVCSPPPSQPVVVTTPSELVTLPVPTHQVPKPPPPPPSQPVVVTTPSELVTLPVPTHQVPKPPPPVVVDSPDDLVQLPIPPPYPAPVKPPDESTPVQIYAVPPKSPLDTQMLQELNRVSKAGVVVQPPPPVEEDIEVEEEDSDTGKYIIGGILLLAVGGGAAYYLLRKKKKRK